jgi:DNA repair protein RecO (recombination protein O)
MRLISTTGIILKKQNCGEFDQFIVLYSPLLGKIDAIAKGSRKINSHFTGHLEIPNICHFQLYKSSRNYLITECKTQSVFKSLRSNLNKTWLALLLIEIFQKTTISHENGASFFNLLEKTLNDLNNNKTDSIYLENFKIKLLKLLGILPDFSQCSFCGEKVINTKKAFIDNEGHFACIDCKIDNAQYDELAFNVIKLINFLSKNNLPENLKLRLNASEKQALKKTSDILLHNYINREIVSEKIITRLMTTS